MSNKHRPRLHAYVWPLAAAVALATLISTDRAAARSSYRETTAQDSAGPLLVMNAASVTQPMKAVLDSFAARTNMRYALEPGASLEIARRVTELHREPDVIVLADPEVFPQLLMPAYTNWYALFGRNRIVLAYTAKSRGAAEINAQNWRTIIQRPGVETGRADPNTDPSGYRTLLTFQLAEQFYHEPGLGKRLLAAAPERNVRPREADQVGLLQTHELDYIWTYQNLADNDKLKYVQLPDAIDLGAPADSSIYAHASTRVVGKRPGDSLTVRGAPILFAVSSGRTAPHAAAAKRFIDYMLSADGQRILRGQHFDALAKPITVGTRP
ncbi:MAG TPA: extracellular solute-binding protein [Gemmatimonadaceae bacterium]|jgi:molybdate/tungstate transport system substrate-binding protein